MSSPCYQDRGGTSGRVWPLSRLAGHFPLGVTLAGTTSLKSIAEIDIYTSTICEDLSFARPEVAPLSPMLMY